MATLLDTTTLTHQQSEYLSIIKESGTNLLGIINDILDMSKLDANKLDINSESMSLQECIASAFDVLVSQAEQKKLDFRYEIADDVPRAIISDANRIRQILVNLLSNAIKFTDKGSVVAVITAQVVAPPLEPTLTSAETPMMAPTELTAETTTQLYDIKFTIIDTGIGINDKSMKYLFKPFTQIDQSNSRSYHGTGLGLAISLELSKLMGGSAWCEKSESGAGSTFCFNIRAYADSLPTPTHTGLEGKRVLVVEDNTANMLVICGLLLRWGMLPTSCVSGDVALMFMRNGYVFDFGLIDICMPKMDGIELASRIHDCVADIPLIALSSISVMTVDPSNFTNVLAKPISEQKLYAAISALFVDDDGGVGAGANGGANVGAIADTNTALMQPLSLPQPSQPLSLPQPSQSQSQSQSQPPSKPHRILVAEDIETNQKVIMGMLRKLGYINVDVVVNGKIAVEQAIKGNYDLILMDIKMPVMGGYEAAKSIAKNMRARPIIVALTAIAMKGDRERYLRRGFMDDYITKPINIDELNAKLNALLNL
jgi:CheY-like chemotaxis protein